jgi:LPXTG-site transpeptidase (sortase) family protein
MCSTGTSDQPARASRYSVWYRYHSEGSAFSRSCTVWLLEVAQRLVFYNLDELTNGDSIVLKDSLGIPYEYRVSESFVVEPDAEWAVQPVRGRDMVTLQTCTFPDLVNRLIVRADRV